MTRFWSPRNAAECCGTTSRGSRSVPDRIARSFDREIQRSTPDTAVLPETVPVSMRLIELLGDVAESRPTVLDLGCGTGSTAIRLAQRGASRVTGFDVSPASVEVARRRAASLGLEESRARFEVADVASTRLPPQDWVLLDRVICCYHDAAGLIANTLPAAVNRLAFSVPESRGWKGGLNRIEWGVENVWKAVSLQPKCRGYVHDIDAIEDQITAAGFRRLRDGYHRLWYIAVFQRV